jgi:hypothetical protein
LRETLDDAFGQYIVKRVNKRFNKAQFAAKMVEETNYALMDFYEVCFKCLPFHLL